jgi:hypothetical protein
MREIRYIFACKCCVNNVCTMTEQLTLQDIESHKCGPQFFCWKKNLLIPNQLFFEAFHQIADKLSFSITYILLLRACVIIECCAVCCSMLMCTNGLVAATIVYR